MNIIKVRWWLCALMLMLSSGMSPLYASHIVGGEITYKCLGPAGNGVRYEIELTIYQDCLTGNQVAIDDDVPAFLGIYDRGSNAIVVKEMGLNPSANNLVPRNFNNSCVNNPPNTCLNKVVFTKQYTLPVNNSGYTVIYQRCCRNAGIVNIVNPDVTGATYFCTIPAFSGGLCNNSAKFKNFPPQIICINNPLFYDHSANDADGDSLSYEFCESYSGGARLDAKPEPPPSLPGLPPVVIYQGFFSAGSPMAGSPPIKIDPLTGIISGTPNMLGRYVVTVCCHEWRNGMIINTVKREFQFVVTNCSKAVVADIPQYSGDFNTYIVNCTDKTVKFINQSSGGFDYFWDFGDGSTSTDFEPVHSYDDTGTYIAKLVVNRGSTCPDSISRFVKIYPVHLSDFGYSGIQCPKTPVNFFDSTVTSFGNVDKWLWNFGDGQGALDKNPVHAFENGGTYKVTLISGSEKGCLDTAEQEIVIETFIPYAGEDTIIVKGERIKFFASGGLSYLWTPATNLSNPETNTPTGYYPEVGHYDYNVHIISPFGCEGDDSIRVWVVNQGSIFVPSAFTPNGDGTNDFLKPIGIGYAEVEFFGVFNRWGERVFTSENFSKGWDGRYKGTLAPTDTYFWLLKVTDKDGKKETLKGDVTLIR